MKSFEIKIDSLLTVLKLKLTLHEMSILEKGLVVDKTILGSYSKILCRNS